MSSDGVPAKTGLTVTSSERTIISLQSNHGCSTQERTYFDGRSAGCLCGTEFSLFEGGADLPAMEHRPGQLALKSGECLQVEAKPVRTH
jgi:hypothetical protein